MSKQINDLNKSLEEQLYLNEKQDKTDNNLKTNDKTVVGAINELFQNANNGKQLIASAIGEPLSSNDTFSAMSSDINGLLSTFKTNMINNGVTVESGDKFKALIDKIATLADSEGKGIKYATGSVDGFKFSRSYNLTINPNLEFTPSIVFVVLQNVYNNFSTDVKKNGALSSEQNTGENNKISISLQGGFQAYFNSIGSNAISLTFTSSSSYTQYIKDPIKWYAIGVGEEDTTLRDSLASILTEEGVTVTEEDDMASLINKVDEEFAKDNNTISELEDDIENTRNTLAGLMQEGGYDINGNDTIDDLLDLLIVSGIKSNEIKQISSGNAYSMLLTTDGSLYATGSGSDGRTGLGDTVKRMAFVNVLDDVVQVACGNNYTLVVKNDGSLWGCGFNENGQLGLSGTADRLTFTEITTGVKQVACG